jgi:hypothetical protein
MYLKQAIEETCGFPASIPKFNDTNGFEKIVAVIRLAREKAQDVADGDWVEADDDDERVFSFSSPPAL